MENQNETPFLITSLSKIIALFIRITFYYYTLNFFYYMLIILNYSYPNNFNFNYTIFYDKFLKFSKRLQKKLLIYNGLNYSDSDSGFDFDFDFDSDSDLKSIMDSTTLIVKSDIKYEDKYLDDIKKLKKVITFNLDEIKLKDDKFYEFYNVLKNNYINQKYELNQQIVEKGLQFISIDDDGYCDIKELKQKNIESEILLLRDKVTELEKTSDELMINNAMIEAQNFVIKERLDGLKNSFIIEKTPLGNVIMYWNNSRSSFEYYSDNTIPYRYLETIGRKYIKTFNCRQIFVDMEFELSEFERKFKIKKDLEEKQKKELEEMKKIDEDKNLVNQKKDVFAKFKNYNTESGTGKVNRGVAPPKNSIPNNNNIKNSLEKAILKENANRYTCEGKLVNFSFLKKPDRKIIDKKYAMTFADYKKLNL